VSVTGLLRLSLWRGLEVLAEENNLTVAELIGLVEESHDSQLSSTLRLYLSRSRMRH
jgi:predicted DNA-binding ribbon-helix-helix protein